MFVAQWHAQRWQKNVTYTHNNTYSTLGDDETIDIIDPLVEDISLKLTENKAGAWYMVRFTKFGLPVPYFNCNQKSVFISK